VLRAESSLRSKVIIVSEGFIVLYRVIQEELPPLMELISEDILSKKCHINLGPILNIYRVTFVIGNALL
jgi:hypothetical protein